MKKKELSIKDRYSDISYWITSSITKDEVKTNYHLTRVEEAVLRKLTHYDKKYDHINFKNETISEHTFISVSHLKKIIPTLNRLGYISTSIKSYYENGEHKKSRTIRIIWEFLEEIERDLIKYQDELKVDVVDVCVENSANTIIENTVKKYSPEDEINLYDVLPKIGFTTDETIFIIDYLGGESEPEFKILARALVDLKKESKYNDYKGPNIDERIINEIIKLKK